MKELSIEDKAKAYDEALERAKKELNTCGSQYCDAARQIFRLFPELKESEDEKIRKWLISQLKIKLDDTNSDLNIMINKAITWLEKQGEQKPILDFKASNWYVSKVDGKIHDMAYNPTDKVEPKFHKGEWIVWQDKCYKVNYNGCGYELVDQNGLITSLEYGTVEENAHLWDITKDAKDGDVLVIQKTDVTYESIFIFNKIENNRIIQHLHYLTTDADEKVCEARSIDGFLGFVGTTVHPATKEQRETLFKAMADAGWEFDFEKKELKKIEHWSGKDEANFQCVLSYVNSNPLLEDVNVENCISWLKSNKDRLEQK